MTTYTSKIAEVIIQLLILMADIKTIAILTIRNLLNFSRNKLNVKSFQEEVISEVVL